MSSAASVRYVWYMVCMVCWGLSYVVKFIAEGRGRYGLIEDCGVSNAEYHVHLVHMNRLSACGEFCGVRSWQNGTRCRDGVKVSGYHSHLVWLVFEDSIPTGASFHSENFL